MLMLSQEKFNKARSFIYRNARPLDLIRWKYHFEDGSKSQVLEALSAYQNLDGGFGHALEPDSWNPNSSPIQTWAAIEILTEIDFNDNNHSIIKMILCYLDSEQNFINGKWINTIKSNNNYPHAPWWEWELDTKSNYNPTANFIGFIFKYADKNSSLYKKAINLANLAVEDFLKKEKIGDGHLLLCYLRLYQSCKDIEIEKISNFNAFKEKITLNIQCYLNNIRLDWISDGVVLEYIKAYKDNLYEISNNIDLTNNICRYIIENMQSDGTWKIPWSWNDYSNAWSISKNWWKSYGVVVNLLFLKEFNYIQS